jgi:glycosyltransferase involved in cell wall biosynthesis
MKILHCVKRSLVRFTPARIATYWGRYTEHTGIGIATARPGGEGKYREPLNPQGIFCLLEEQKRLAKIIQTADVLHCHDDSYPTRLPGHEGKILVYHAHIGDIPKRRFQNYKFAYNKHVRHACITNGYGRHFDQEQQRSGVTWGRLPDILDLEHPVYRPNYEKRPERFTVVFTFSNTAPRGAKINAKDPKAVERLLRPLREHGIAVNLVSRVKFEESMAVKQSAHIVLDEVFSPYTHLSALEGAAVGTCPMTSFDDYTVNELCDYVGSPRSDYPFVRVTPKTIVRKIRHFEKHRDEAEEIGRKAREWMERYYHPKRLLGFYEEFYKCDPRNLKVFSDMKVFSSRQPTA